MADVFVVTKVADTADGVCDADCSLREAFIAANQEPEASVVLVGAGLYLLTRAGRGEDASLTGDLDVTSELQVIGAGASQTIIDGNRLDRVVHVLSGRSAELRGLTLRNGSATGPGGGICSEGELKLEGVVVADNRSVGERGGGVFATRLEMENSTVSGNEADDAGGGIYAAGVRLSNLTVSGNVSPAGGIYLLLKDGDTLLNLTITGNQGSGLIGDQPDCAPGDPTCLPKTAVSNSILAGNSGGPFPDCSGGVGSAGYNLYGLPVDCEVTATDREGVAGAPLDPKLGPLSFIGGTTPVHPLLSGSPAIDAGSPLAPGAAGGCTPTDQRGVGRPMDGDQDGVSRCDIGAVEQTTGCVPDPSTLCLNQNRFRVTTHWQTGQGTSGVGQAVALTPETGYFWFFSPANVEVVIKVLDACTLNSRFWVFSTGLTDVGVEIEVLDVQTGQSRIYSNSLGAPFAPQFDTSAFATCP